MGSSAKGILCYGVQMTSEEGELMPWHEEAIAAGYGDNEEHEYEEDQEVDEDEWLAFKLCGVPRPDKPYSEETEDEYSRYWDKKRRALENLGLSLEFSHFEHDVVHASVLAVRKLTVTASCEAVRLDCLETLAEQVTTPIRVQLIEAAKKLGVSDPKPSWFLLSNYG